MQTLTPTPVAELRQDRRDPTTHALRARMIVPAILTGMILVGLGFRAAPLLNHEGRLLKQFPTEDGYLMLTVARNLAIGHGMSTADGTIPTNGVQPAATFLWTLCYLLVGGDKTTGVLLVQICSIAIIAAAALVLYRLGQQLMGHLPYGKTAAGLAAAAWFAAPMGIEHSMNGLESGLNALCVLLVLSAYISGFKTRDAHWSFARCVGVGLLMGLCFWARIDAVWLILACCLVRLFSTGLSQTQLLVRLREAVIMGTTSILAASPWLIHNKIHFGSIMPISGSAQSQDVVIGGNLVFLPAKLFEYLIVVLAVPASVERKPLVMIACGIALTLTLILLLAVRRRQPCTYTQRIFLAAAGLYAVFLCGFYGLFFGAGHFMSRYLFPLSAFGALLSGWLIVSLWQASQTRALRSALVGALAVMLVGMTFLNVRDYLNGNQHQHFQVVEWVQQHVPDETWVGAVQTGTLGYFHDRTINLDGKVNPLALEHRKTNTIPQYVADSPIQYLADWDLLEWYELYPPIRDNFELTICDRARKLTVLTRHGAPGKSDAPARASPASNAAG